MKLKGKVALITGARRGIGRGAHRYQSPRTRALFSGVLPASHCGKTKGSVINVGSIQAGKVLPGRTHYGPTKLGLEALTRNVSAEVSPLGIRVNCIHPGYFDTDMTSWLKSEPQIRESVLGQISPGRAGEPRELGAVAAFLASEEASYVTGQSFFVDSGWIGK